MADARPVWSGSMHAIAAAAAATSVMPRRPRPPAPPKAARRAVPAPHAATIHPVSAPAARSAMLTPPRPPRHRPSRAPLRGRPGKPDGPRDTAAWRTPRLPGGTPARAMATASRQRGHRPRSIQRSKSLRGTDQIAVQLRPRSRRARHPPQRPPSQPARSTSTGRRTTASWRTLRPRRPILVPRPRRPPG